MMDVLASLADTPVPNVLVIAGIVFLLLAVAGKIGANLSIPAQRQTAAAAIGGVLLVSGITLFAIPPPAPQVDDQQGAVEIQQLQKPEVQPEVQEPYGTDDATVRARIVSAIGFAAREELRARWWLDLSVLETIYQGEYLRHARSTIDNRKRNNEFVYCLVPTREIHNINIDEGGRRATVDMTETWNFSVYSVESGDCLGQYDSASAQRQTVFLEQRTSGWMIDNVSFDSNNPETSIVACTEAWPANQKR